MEYQLHHPVCKMSILDFRLTSNQSNENAHCIYFIHEGKEANVVHYNLAGEGGRGGGDFF